MPNPTETAGSQDLTSLQAARTSAERPEWAVQSPGPTLENILFHQNVEEPPVSTKADPDELSMATGPAVPEVNPQPVQTSLPRPPYAAEGGGVFE